LCNWNGVEWWWSTLGSVAGNTSLVRLVNLVELLVSARRPITMDEIYQKLPDLPEGDAAKRQAVERAKSSLKAMGYPIRTETSPYGDQVGYRIHREDLYLDVRLSDDEQRALALALGAVGGPDSLTPSLARKLGILADPNTVLTLPTSSDQRVPELLNAVDAHRFVTFRYLGRDRVVAPYGLIFRFARWYLVGSYDASKTLRTFRLDRIESTIGQLEREFDRPAEISLADALANSPLAVAEGEPIEVELVADAYAMVELRDTLEATSAQVDNARGHVAFQTSSLDATVSLLVGLGEHLTVLGSSALLEAIRRWSTAMRANADRPVDATPLDDERQAEGGTVPRPNQASATAIRKFQLLEQLLPYLQSVGTTSLTELSRRTGVKQGELLDLLETAALCGLPPYGPENLYEVLVSPEEDLVEVSMLDSAIAEPRRLEYAEAVAFQVAYQFIRPLLADSAESLDSAYRKIQQAVRRYLSAVEVVDVSIEMPPSLGVLRSAITEGRTVGFRYASAHSGEVRDRIVDPLSLRFHEQHWYLVGVDREFEDLRTYRLSRIVGDPTIDDVFEPSDLHRQGLAQKVPFRFPSEGVTVRFAVDLAGSRILEQVATAAFTSSPLTDGYSVVELSSRDARWLGRVVRACGPHAWPVEGDVGFAEAQRRSAEELLARYR
jgi:predicted DNA-binding transcriptional regulator YafY